MISNFDGQIVYAMPGTEFYEAIVDGVGDKYYGFNLRDLIEQNGNYGGL